MSNSSATSWTVAHQAPLSMKFPRQGYWSGLSFPLPGDLPDPGIEPESPAWHADSLRLSDQGSPSVYRSVGIFSPTDVGDSPPQFSKINWVSWNSTQFWDSIRSRTFRAQSHKIDPTSELGIDMYTLPSLKWITSKNLLYSAGTLFNVIWQPGREGSWERMDTCIHMAEALCCPPETHMVNPIYSNIK